MQSSFWKTLTNTIEKLSQKVASKWTFILLCLLSIHVLFGGHWYRLFLIFGNVSSGVQSQSGFCLIHFFGEVNTMYIPWDPPLVLHISTSWWLASTASPVPTYCCRGEVARIRTRALRISVSQTLYQLS